MIERFVLVKLKAATRITYADGRVLGHHGQFGNLHALPLLPALRLVASGQAKLLDQFRLDRLRADVERQAAERATSVSACAPTLSGRAAE